MRRSARFLALTAGVAVLALTGCSAPDAGESADSENTAAAEADGAFTLYSGRDEELVQPLIDMFEDESGITVDVRYGNTAELGALLLEEGDRTPAQVFLAQDAGALGALSNADLFTTLPDETTSRVAAGFTSTDDT
ncbi:MAG: iron ABC transporter substrate-binding protein, partial [Cryobacterium sp.]